MSVIADTEMPESRKIGLEALGKALAMTAFEIMIQKQKTENGSMRDLGKARLPNPQSPRPLSLCLNMLCDRFSMRETHSNIWRAQDLGVVNSNVTADVFFAWVMRQGFDDGDI